MPTDKIWKSSIKQFNMNAWKSRILTERAYLSEENPDSNSYFYFEIKEVPSKDIKRSIDIYISDGGERVRLTSDEVVGLSKYLNRLIKIWNLKEYKAPKEKKRSWWREVFERKVGQDYSDWVATKAKEQVDSEGIK